MTARHRLEWSPGAAGPALRLADPDPHSVTWHDFALCAEADPECWFPEKGGSTREAKKICARCPVRAQCLEYALGNDLRFGIWGGLSEQERRRLQRETVPRLTPRGAGVARYRELAAQGLEPAVIAERMGVTRDRVWRLARSARRQEKREANAA
jgi:WhiB family transcriptional regulator, redox-sensing transcriptional regulator